MVYTLYPSAIDSSNELPLSVDNVTPIRSEVVNRIREAVLAVETELGVQPSSTFTTVRDRLDDFSARIADLAEQVEGMQIAGGGSVRVKENGVTKVVTATTMDFLSGATITASGNTALITIASGLPGQLTADNTTSGNNIVVSSGDEIKLASADGTGFILSFETDATANGGDIHIIGQSGNSIGTNNGGNIYITPGIGTNGGIDGYTICGGNLQASSILLETTLNNEYNNSIWRSTNEIYYTDSAGVDKKLFDYTTYGPFIAIAGAESTDAVSPGTDAKGCLVFDPTIIDGYSQATFTFNAVLETTDGYLPAEIYLYNLTAGAIVNSFSVTPLTTTSISPALLQRTLEIGTDLPASQNVYQVRIRFESGTPTELDRVTCRLAEIRVS